MKNNLDINLLSRFSIFEELDKKNIKKFTDSIKIKSFKKNEPIIKEGNSGNSILFLLEGDISISQALTLKTIKHELSDNRQKELIRISSENSYFTFGEVSLFNPDKKRSATVKALSNCKIGKLPFKDIFNICNSNHDVGYILMKNISKIITKQLINSNHNVLKLTTAFSLIVDD